MLVAPRALAAAFAALVALGASACASSGADAAAAETPEEAAAKASPRELCLAASPCPNAQQTDAELATCVAAMRDLLGDPCLEPMIAVKTCAVEKIRCTEGGELDEDATSKAMDACSRELAAFDACCAAGKESALCP
ncbi:MAG: hypothetical protein KC635_12085 [Myxococcales bacterium]|nr:hypothetical protein [Myxococcales bacterium]MCB9737078.1 hypothetical protein [Deltaproteobacteria bacterium]